MKIIFLSSDYQDKTKRYGDCILIIFNNQMLVYDCGSKEHALRVVKEMNKLGIKKINGVLSHNDSDHVEGFKTLIQLGKINTIYTICALKHKNTIYKKMNNKRYSIDNLATHITDSYDNIAELSGHLTDIYTSSNTLIDTEIFPNVKIVSPSYDYATDTIAKDINSYQSNSKDGDTVKNAPCVCLKIEYRNESLLLTGDSTFVNIEQHLDGLTYIQCPRHCHVGR